MCIDYITIKGADIYRGLQLMIDELTCYDLEEALSENGFVLQFDGKHCEIEFEIIEENDDLKRTLIEITNIYEY